MRITWRPAALGLVMLAICIGVTDRSVAHPQDMLDSMNAPHKGTVRAIGGYHIELLPKSGLLTFYLTDHMWAAQPAAGASGTATIRTGKHVVKIELHISGGNSLSGSGDFKLGPGTVVEATLDLPNLPPGQVLRFERLCSSPNQCQ